MGEYLQEAVLPVQYDNYVFDLYGHWWISTQRKIFQNCGRNWHCFLDITGPFMNRRNCRKRYAALVSDCERALKKTLEEDRHYTHEASPEIEIGEVFEKRIRKKGSWPIRPLPYIPDSFSVHCLPIMSVCIRGHSRCLPV